MKAVSSTVFAGRPQISAFRLVCITVVEDKTAVEALNQAALQAYFFPGNEQVRALARRIGRNVNSAGDCEKLIRSLRVGEFIYIDKYGLPVVACVPNDLAADSLIPE